MGIGRLTAAAVLVAGMTFSAHAQSDRDAKGLIAEWTAANSQCRGGSGDAPETMAACAKRQALGRSIYKQAGFCYGKDGQYAYQYQWHKCGAGSLRPDEGE